MFNFTSSMLLESTDSLFSDTKISTSQLRDENYFDTAIYEASSIADQYTEAKKKLYSGLANSTEEFKDLYSKAYETSFPGKDKNAVSESCSSTEHFIKYFGKSIEILNTAIGNIASSCDCMCNQAPIMMKEATKVLGVLEKSELCPACGTSPCSCKVHNEDLYKFTTKNGVAITKFNFTGMDKAIAGGEDFENEYKNLTEKAADEACARRGKLCGLKEGVSVSLFGEAVVSNFRSVKKYPINVNHRYLDYCIETINSFPFRVEEVKRNAKAIAEEYKEAVDNVQNAMYASDTGECNKDGVPVKVAGDDGIQNMDIYCKAKVDELVSACNDHIISIGAKLDAMKCEFDQCKAILSKYVCGNAQPIVLPEHNDEEEDYEELRHHHSHEQEEERHYHDHEEEEEHEYHRQFHTPEEEEEHHRHEEEEERHHHSHEEEEERHRHDHEEEEMMNRRRGDYSGLDLEYESVDYYLTHGDTRSSSVYAESYESFLTDMLVNESMLQNYINNVVLGESEQAIVEGALSKGKGLLQRFVDFIKKIWGKFTNAMAGLFQNDMKYLGDNKDLILGNKYPFKNANIDKWYNYDLKRIQEDQLTELNTDVKSNLIINAQNTMTLHKITDKNSPVAKCGDAKTGVDQTYQMYFIAHNQDFNIPKENNVNDKFKAYFSGYPISRNASTISIKEREAFYNYCYAFKSDTLAKLQKDIDTVDELYNMATESLDALASEVKTDDGKDGQEANDTTNQTADNKNASTDANKNGQGNTNTQTTGGSNGNGGGNTETPTPTGGNDASSHLSSTDMASVFDTYFSEMKISNTTTSSGGDGTNKDYKASVTGATDAQKNANNNPSISNANFAKSFGVTKEDVDMMSRALTNLFTIVKGYVAVKLSCGQSAYNDYMRLFRWHVGEYKGTADRENSDGAIANNQQ